MSRTLCRAHQSERPTRNGMALSWEKVPDKTDITGPEILSKEPRKNQIRERFPGVTVGYDHVNKS